MERNRPKIFLVLPCYNEADALPQTLRRLTSLLDRLSTEGKVASGSAILCVDDGSTDATWSIITGGASLTQRITGLRLARNYGQQTALMAGLKEVAARCDAAITLDADLQDDPSVIPMMLNEFTDGADTVYGVRRSRDTDSRAKRWSARAFYSVRSKLAADNVRDHSDFRLMSATVLCRLAEYGEANLYLRGLLPLLGGKTAVVEYDRAERVAGRSKYAGRSMVSLALDGITSFTSRPIRAIFIVGLVLLILDVAVALYVFISYFRGDSIQGWTSLMLSVWFLGSILLMAVGIIGEYIGKIYIEVKRRPRWFIRERTEEL